jgi:ribonuclease HIII
MIKYLRDVKMIFVFKPSDNIKKKMIDYYEPLKKDKTPPYAVFQAMDADTTITLYESGKVVFQGLSADIDARLWQEMEKKFNNRNIELEDSQTKKKKDIFPANPYLKQIATVGSDEVGTGDYFGPIIVSAAYVSKENISLMKELGVNDSKKIADEKIANIAPTLIKNIPYVSFKLSNEEYNTLPDKNMNKIKALLHNKVLVKILENPEVKPEKVVIDQFVYPSKFYEHIKDSQKKVSNILFLTKAESQVYSVAAASIISRYLFLTEMKNLSKELGKHIPLGAGTDVDNFGKEIIKEKGAEILQHIAKINFKNTEKILNN